MFSKKLAWIGGVNFGGFQVDVFNVPINGNCSSSLRDLGPSVFPTEEPKPKCPSSSMGRKSLADSGGG